MLFCHRKHLREIIFVDIVALLRVEQLNRVSWNSHFSIIAAIFRVKILLLNYLITLLFQTLH